jgi:hypothetical protein
MRFNLYSNFICIHHHYKTNCVLGMKNCGNLPAEMKIDFVRLYQDTRAADHTLSCSPPGFPTSVFIADFPERYQKWDSDKKIIFDKWHNKAPIFFLLLLIGFGVVCAASRIDNFMFNKIFSTSEGRRAHTKLQSTTLETGNSNSSVPINEKSPLVRKFAGERC